ncbi:MAG: multidrug resistance protein [Nitrospirales bacterium]|nr:MAG: multidrug resistance protein [Nitrospirales bacterium]
MASDKSLPPSPGPISWMVRHHVAANLVMVMFILGGLLVSTRVKQEVFPEFEVDVIRVSVAYPGASPEEVEQGIILSIEDAVRGLDGVDQVVSTASEGSALVQIELTSDANTNSVLQDVNNEIEGIQSFPDLAESPIISLVEVRHQVLTIMVYGNQEEQTLRDVAERIRDDLLQRPGITLVDLGMARSREIAIEVSQRHLRAYGLTLNEIAEKVRETAIELPGGGVKTDSGEVLLRTQERRDFGQQYAGIPITSTPDGASVTINDIATITDGFEDDDQEAFYNGQRAIQVNIFRVGNETPQSISDNVYAYLKEFQPELPENIDLAVWADQSEIYRDRVKLLLKNAFIGLVLVLLLLGLFLDPKLAFWVTLGLPTAILGSFLFIPLTGASINMISLFAFIVTLGIIVDDAVMTGEIIYQKREEGLPFLDAAIVGAREIAGPISFAVLTNIAAFLPLFFVPGTMGNFMRQVPSVVVAVFVVSLIESLFVLPAHLTGKHETLGIWHSLSQPRIWFSEKMYRFIHHTYQPTLRTLITHRYLTVAVGIALLILSLGVVAGGHVPFSFMPSIDSEIVTTQATLPYGVPIETTRDVLQRLFDAANATVQDHGGEQIVRGVYAQIGSAMPGFGPNQSSGGPAGSHLVGMQISLVPTDQRAISGVEFAKAWREEIGVIPGLESLTFKAETGPSSGAAIDIQLTHRSRTTLEAAATELAGSLAQYKGVADIEDGVSRGKPQLSFRIRPEAQSLGLNATDLAQQVRGAFYGIEALRQQRGRDEVKVMVRLPVEARRTYHTVEDLILFTDQGGEIALAEAADIDSGFAYTQIKRRNGRRIVAVTADVDEQISNANIIIDEVMQNELLALQHKYPGLLYSLEGEQASQQESLAALQVGFLFALLLIYGLLAIPFRSYVQPLIVMLCIPFGIIGAIVGHVLLGYGLSIISAFGIVALAGVVVNDSLVLIVSTNRIRDAESTTVTEAVIQGAMRRFRPIVLTSLTTFFGLAPMIFETSMQARFIVPMAISLGFGILFGSVIILTIVPSVYCIFDDFAGLSLWHKNQEFSGNTLP